MATDRQRKELAERLKAARDYVGLSQEDVAQALGIPRSAVSLMENGERGVEALELTRLAEIYERPVEYFTGKTFSASKDVELLARAAADLSPKDIEELARFAEFLKGRSKKVGRK